jgi:hypothetical protein
MSLFDAMMFVLFGSLMFAVGSVSYAVLSWPVVPVWMLRIVGINGKALRIARLDGYEKYRIEHCVRPYFRRWRAARWVKLPFFPVYTHHYVAQTVAERIVEQFKQREPEEWKAI